MTIMIITILVIFTFLLWPKEYDDMARRVKKKKAKSIWNKRSRIVKALKYGQPAVIRTQIPVSSLKNCLNEQWVTLEELPSKNRIEVIFKLADSDG